MYRYLVALLLFLSGCGSLLAADKVVLQLKWEHEFQFAGYYAAKWQGFYKDAGIEVEIRPASSSDGNFIGVVDSIVQGKADFAIGSLDILLANDQGNELTILAPIFQRSPAAIYSLKDTPIDSLSQLAKLRIAVVTGDATQLEIEALLRVQGYPLDKIQFVDAPVTIDTLLTNKADAIVTYETSAEYIAKEQSILLNKFKPSDYGFNFYGDTLFTSYKLAQSNPELVRNFIQATKKGWLYAIDNKLKIATKIADTLPRHSIFYEDFLQYNLAFADKIEYLLDYPNTPIGTINQEHWFSINERIRSLGVLYAPLNKETIFFTPPQPKFDLSNKLVFYPTIIFLVIMVFYFWYRRWMILTILTVSTTAYFAQHHIEHALEDQNDQKQKLGFIQQLNSVAAVIEGDLQTNLSMINGFAAYIAARPNLTHQEFNNYAQQVFKKAPLAINFAAAKDLVVNYVYPLKGNENIVGLDYLANEDQREMVLQIAKSGQLLVVGPLKLVQGHLALIGRAPVFYHPNGEKKLWGIVSAPLDLEKLYQHSGIKNIQSKLNLAIKSYDSLGQEQKVFIGHQEYFEHPKAVRQVINVGGGTWHLAAAPLQSADTLPLNIMILRIAAAISALFLVLLVIFRFRQNNEREVMQEKLLNNQRLLEKVGSVAQIGGWKLDKNMSFVQWSQQTSSLLGQSADYQPSNLSDLMKLFDSEQADLLFKKISDSFNGETSIDFDIPLKTANETKIWLRVIASASRLSPQNLLTGTMQNVTDKVENAQLIRRQATFDSLTNLPNRVLFNDRLVQAIENAQRNQNQIAVLFIDLDRFKPVNDNYGHQVGDKLLIEAASRILPCVRESDTVSRLSGDEFGVLLNNINHFDDVTLVTDKINEAMQLLYEVEGNKLHCSASIGISIYPNDGDRADLLLRKADQAMYQVKKSGRNGWHFYTNEMQQQSEYRHKLMNQLIFAVSNDKLVPYFQPIYELKNDQLVKCEALARWQKSDGTFVPPIEFITLAEETGLINTIDLKMLKAAAKAIIKANQKNDTQINLAINVSPRLFQTKDNALETWLDSVKQLSQKLTITVEITERLITDDTAKALDVLNQLKSFGVKIAIDDFGTGYSSLSYLVRFPVDIIKIDQSFIADIGLKSSAESLIETLMIMAKKLNIQVVAEGIETKEQLNFLRKLDCDFGQGYYLAKPLAAEEFIRLTQENRG